MITLDDMKKDLEDKPMHVFLNDNIRATERGFTLGHFMKWGEGLKKLQDSVLELYYVYLVLNADFGGGKCEECENKECCPVAMFSKFGEVNAFYVLYTKVIHQLFDVDIDDSAFIDYFISKVFKKEADVEAKMEFLKVVVNQTSRYIVNHEADIQLRELIKKIDPKDLLTKNFDKNCN